MDETTVTLAPRPPYSFDLTAGYLAYFRGRYAADVFEGGVFRRLLDIEGKRVLASVRSTGSVDEPRLGATLAGLDLDGETGAEASRQVAWMLGVDQDLAPFYEMAEADEHLSPLAQALRGLHLPRTPSVYEALVLAILGQQISFHVARILRTLLIQTYGRRMEAGAETYYAFPSPDSLANAGVDRLTEIKFSRRKAEYVVGIATGVASGELDLEGLRGQPAEEAVPVLTGIRGVGPWTAQWLLIRALGHTDGFPDGDLALQRTLGHLVNGGPPLSAEEALRCSERWSPYRSFATAYLFAAARSGQLSLARFGEVGP